MYSIKILFLNIYPLNPFIYITYKFIVKPSTQVCQLINRNNCIPIMSEQCHHVLKLHIRIVGRVCMDQLMVDVSALPDVREGDEAILWGGTVSDSAETIARKTDTISYEVLCGVSRRVPRVYLENGGVKAVEDWIL